MAYDFREKCEKNDAHLREILSQGCNIVESDDTIAKDETEQFNPDNMVSADAFLDDDSVEILSNDNDCLVISDDDFDDCTNSGMVNAKYCVATLDIDTNFCCPICGTFCTNQGGLASHMKVHSTSSQGVIKT